MTQQEFYILSEKYINGQTTKAENDLLELWFKENSETEVVNLSSSQQQKLERKMWFKIQQGQKPFQFKKFLPYIGIAATILVLMVWNFNPKTPVTLNAFETESTKELSIEIKNITNKQENIKLEDGTTVFLDTNGIIRYNSNTFNKLNREIFLSGSASFKVKHDVSRPFIVHAGNLITEVLGTEFMIKQNGENNRVEVAVKSGRVSVYSLNEKVKNDINGVILTPNQMVSFSEKTQNIEQKIVANPSPLIDVEEEVEKLNFQEVTVQQVIKDLNSIYGLEFIITNQKLNDCKITADLNNLEMFTQLELICKAIGATYEKRGTVIFINGDGCD